MVLLIMEISFSILIPAWNEEKTIKRSCSYLGKLKLPFKYSEIIFIAGGDDNTYNICKEIKLDNFKNKIILKQHPKEYKSGALIKGIKSSKGDYITLIDADTIVTPNLLIEIVDALKTNDVVNCNYYPMISRRSFWYKYYILNKKIWAKNPNNLNSLFGAATISLKRDLINEIGIKNLFTNKSTAGVDHYMGIILKKNEKSIGFVKKTYVITPRPSNIKDFMRDQNRWFRAFFQLHDDDRRLILITLFISFLSCLFPPINFLLNFKKLITLKEKSYRTIKYFLILSLSEYLLNLSRVKASITQLANRAKSIGHFKGIRD
ncbi:MAG: glycosyltransferase [Candidatus Odinarchaeota archaeon]